MASSCAKRAAAAAQKLSRHLAGSSQSPCSPPLGLAAGASANQSAPAKRRSPPLLAYLAPQSPAGSNLEDSRRAKLISKQTADWIRPARKPNSAGQRASERAAFNAHLRARPAPPVALARSRAPAQARPPSLPLAPLGSARSQAALGCSPLTLRSALAGRTLARAQAERERERDLGETSSPTLSQSKQIEKIEAEREERARRATGQADAHQLRVQ